MSVKCQKRKWHDAQIWLRLPDHLDPARRDMGPAIRLDPPLWLRSFQAAYARAEEPKLPIGQADDFLAAVEPVIAIARDRIDAALRGPISGVGPAIREDRAALVASLELGLRRRLFDVISKTLVLELAVASRRKILAGNSSEDRFSFF
jgi:hypothetical protein